jgi:predicted ATPase/DNA-binding CsgD family transcriptional regulator
MKHRVVTRLPAEVTSFVGRRRELAGIKRLYSTARLVTLTGVGGVGKTRLALQFAGSRQAFPDGVFLAELEDLTDPRLITQVVATAIGIQDDAGNLRTTLTDYISDKHLLLVLDNCEHLSEGCGLLILELLQACPQLRVLATSREPLRVAGEHVFVVPPLSTPDPDQAYTPDSLARYEATKLLLDRAAAVVPNFAVTPENSAALVQLCQRLDGIPLSVELAAARLPGLSAEEILRRIEDRFHLLTRGIRQAPARHRTLSALMGWSFDLCSPAEQRLWARLSVFPGGFDLPAAQAVCSGDGLTHDDVYAAVAGLVDKSVLIRDESVGVARYRMLETLREYGRLKLTAAPDDEAALLRKHRDWYRGVAGQAKREWFGANQVEWLAHLQRDQANLRAALKFSLNTPGEARAALDLAAALWFYWIAAGFLIEGRLWLSQALELDSDATPTRATALWVAAWLAAVQGDFQAAANMLQEARVLGHARDDSVVLAYVAQTDGLSAMLQDDLHRARALFVEALGRHREAEDPAGIVNDLIQLSAITSLQGDFRDAAEFSRECLSLCDAYGERWYKSYALCDLGIALWKQGDTRRAGAVERESIRLSRSFQQKLGIGMGIEILAWIAETDGRSERAARLLGALPEIWRAIGVPPSGLGHFTAEHDRCVARAREELGEHEFEAQQRKGSELDLDVMVAYALEEDTSRPRELAASSPLTRREQQIAELLAAGKTNREIATKLVIARRTAASHVEHILDKLGFSSRTQVAAWIAERRAVVASTPEPGYPAESGPPPL